VLSLLSILSAQSVDFIRLSLTKLLASTSPPQHRPGRIAIQPHSIISIVNHLPAPMMMSLVPPRKRKDTHNPRWASRDKDKVRVVGNSSDRLLSNPTKPVQPRAGRKFTNFRKGSIKILSLFRNGKSKLRVLLALGSPLLNSEGPVTSSALAAAGSISSQSNASDNDQRAEATQASTNLSLARPSIPNIPTILPNITLHERTSSVWQAAVYDGESEPIMSTRERQPPLLHVSRSTPGLSKNLTAKISNTLFHNDTVIHRPKLSSRPSVRTTYFAEDPTNQQDNMTPEAIMSDVPSIPSLPSQLQSVVGSSNGPMSQSTAPTSLMSSGVLVSGEVAQRGQHGSGQTMLNNTPILETRMEQVTSRWLVFPRQDAPRLSVPSVATIENAASAKVFFESHFNQLLTTKVSPRSMRQRNLERKLFTMALPNEQRQNKRRQWLVAESQHLRQTRVMKSQTLIRRNIKGVHVSNYDIVRVLGKGSFGVVRLVREKSEHDSSASGSESRRIDGVDGTAIRGIEQPSPPKANTKQVFAMKVIRKSDMLRNSQEGHLRAERDFLVASENSRWVVPLMAAFQDNTNLYLVMEYMVGGDFLGLLLREDILDENVARWYLAEMILCIDEAHRMNWIHRDVKPDNFLITASGHLKISDFGLAFDGHWTHSQTYYNERRYGLLHDLDLHVDGDAQDVEEDRERQSARKTFELINGKHGSHGPYDARPDGVNGPIIDWLNRTQRRQFAKSVVGTSQYMAPEVIRGEDYDGRCD
jgi:hypothetical protein